MAVYKKGARKKKTGPVHLSVPVATTMWMRHTYTTSQHRTGPCDTFVVLSFITSSTKNGFPLMICVHGTDRELQRPPWPSEWNHEPVPPWKPIAVDTWVGLPDTTAPCEPLLRRSTAAREHEIESALQQRCTEISKHGEDDVFLESLDYYTTVRVKHAYLCMNTETIECRLSDVRKKMDDVRAVVGAADPEIAREWQMPALDEKEGTSLNLPEDPNALCTPEYQDYVLHP